MPSDELRAFWRLDRYGLILGGEFFSPSKAADSYYTKVLTAHLDNMAPKKSAQAPQSDSQPESKADAASS